MDDVGTKLPTDQLATEHFCVEDIGTQLINIESIQRTIRKQVSELENNSAEVSIHAIKSILPKLEALEAGLRRNFDAHARPLIRNLQIFDLPNEVLGLIACNVRDYVVCDFDIPPFSRDIESVKSMRLTCRRFCDASSHLLLPVLRVSITTTSLAHLDEVSRHPSISKGVRSLNICASVYSPTNFRDLRELIGLVTQKLQKDLDKRATSMISILKKHLCKGSYDSSSNFYWEKSPVLDKAQTFERYQNTLLACKKYVEGIPLEPDEDRSISALRRVYEQHRQLVGDQETLLGDDTFAQAVVAAVTRMPTIDGVSISNWEDESFHLLGELSIEAHRAVKAELSIRSHWAPAILSRLQNSPCKLLYQMPLAIKRAVNSLTHLALYVSLGTDLRLNIGKKQIRDLSSLAEHLKVLRISCNWIEPGALANPSPELIVFPELITCLLKSPKLRSVFLDFGDSDYSIQHELLNGVFVGSLLALLPWSNLNEIFLVRFHIHYEKLRKHLKKLKPGTSVSFEAVYLESGIWADVLDVLRGKVGRTSHVIEPGGAIDELLDSCFRSHFSYRKTISEYLRGDRIENPLRRRSDHVPGVKCMYEGDTSEDDTDAD